MQMLTLFPICRWHLYTNFLKRERIWFMAFQKPRSKSSGLFFMGFLKDVVYKNQIKIKMVIRSIEGNILQNVSKNLLRQMNACLDINGRQFQHSL